MPDAPTMKAAVITGHGGLDTIETTTLPVPTPGPGEVRVKVQWAALNHLDLWTREGLPGLKLSFPHVLCSDGAGFVEAVGEGVTDWSADDRVVINPGLSCGTCTYCRAGHDASCDTYHILGEHVPGTAAEHVVVPARQLLAVPDDVPLRKAAAANLAYMTAYRMVVGRAQARPGEHVLVLGAGSGVSSAAIQIARRLGAVVYATTSSPEKMERAKAMGAHHVVDYTSDDQWHKTVFKLSGKRGMDIVVDHVGEATWQKSVRTLRKGGRLVTCGGTTGPQVSQDVRLMFWKQLSLLGSTMADDAEYREVMDLVFRGELDPPIDEVYSLDQMRAAHERMDNARQFGKIMIRVGGKD